MCDRIGHYASQFPHAKKGKGAKEKKKQQVASRVGEEDHAKEEEQLWVAIAK